MTSVDLTQLISAWQSGDSSALNQLMPHVYTELQRLARAQLRRERAGHTLQATALVNEAFLRLADIQVNYQDRAHFLAMAATTMRRVLVDHARRKHSAKRGGDQVAVTLDDDVLADVDETPDVLDLDRALTRLAEVDTQLATCVELVFFGGLSYAEAASAMGTSKTAVFDDLQLAKAWLKDDMGGTNL